MENTKIREFFKDVIRGAAIPLAIGLTALGTIIGISNYANRERTPKAEPEKAPIVDTSSWNFYANPASEYSAGIPMDLQDKIDFIMEGDLHLPLEAEIPRILREQKQEREQPEIRKKSAIYNSTKYVKGRVKNNNPLNLKVVYRYDKKGRKFMIPWAGQIGVDSRGFAIFKDEIYGLRSWLKNAKDSCEMYGTDTLSKLITKCSPPHENDTNNYIKFVAQNLGISPDEKLDLTNKEQMVGLLALVTQKESSAIYPRQTLEKAYSMLYR